jgi:hypothetical protein
MKKVHEQGEVGKRPSFEEAISAMSADLRDRLTTPEEAAEIVEHLTAEFQESLNGTRWSISTRRRYIFVGGECTDNKIRRRVYDAHEGQPRPHTGTFLRFDTYTYTDEIVDRGIRLPITDPGLVVVDDAPGIFTSASLAETFYPLDSIFTIEPTH